MGRSEATLVFDAAQVESILRHSEASAKHASMYGQPETAKPGLWLVGDHGVYLMSNGAPGMMRPDGKSAVVAYADGIDPKKDKDWWDAKRHTFGGDDGSVYLDAAAVRAGLGGEKFRLGITPESVRIIPARRGRER